MRSVLSSQDVANLAGITYRQLHTWVARGHVTASISGPQGPGLPMQFTPVDARRVMKIAQLVGFGVTVAKAAKLADEAECPICGGEM